MIKIMSTTRGRKITTKSQDNDNVTSPLLDRILERVREAKKRTTTRRSRSPSRSRSPTRSRSPHKKMTVAQHVAALSPQGKKVYKMLTSPRANIMAKRGRKPTATGKKRTAPKRKRTTTRTKRQSPVTRRNTRRLK